MVDACLPICHVVGASAAFQHINIHRCSFYLHEIGLLATVDDSASLLSSLSLYLSFYIPVCLPLYCMMGKKARKGEDKCKKEETNKDWKEGRERTETKKSR